MTMPITKENYLELKEYWDYQRKVEYNKELIFSMLEKFQNRSFFRMSADSPRLSLEEAFDEMWSRIDAEDYEEVPKGYVPKNENYRIEGEKPTKFVLPEKTQKIINGDFDI